MGEDVEVGCGGGLLLLAPHCRSHPAPTPSLSRSERCLGRALSDVRLAAMTATSACLPGPSPTSPPTSPIPTYLGKL